MFQVSREHLFPLVVFNARLHDVYVPRHRQSHFVQVGVLRLEHVQKAVQVGQNLRVVMDTHFDTPAKLEVRDVEARRRYGRIVQRAIHVFKLLHADLEFLEPAQAGLVEVHMRTDIVHSVDDGSFMVKALVLNVRDFRPYFEDLLRVRVQQRTFSRVRRRRQFGNRSAQVHAAGAEDNALELRGTVLAVFFVVKKLGHS